MTFLQITALLIVLAGLFGALNYFFLRLPSAIGVLVVALLASLALAGADFVLPSLGVTAAITETVSQIEFSKAL
ncbi:MAG: sodium:proton antiporter, partial [Pseudomonadota bacterium]